MLRRALNTGYEEGYRAGRADREDRWRLDYRDSFAYQDATYGYDGYYVDLSEYRYYFREGFRRGYEDGYDGTYRYGTYSNGVLSLLGGVLQTILNLQRY
jgi:flagellar biosynthesis/type III secretory pathway protein FliH